MKKSRGYTLVELVIAIVIMAIAFYALINVFITVAPQDINARTMTVGAHLMNEKVEETILLGYTNIASSAATPFVSPFDNYYNSIIVDYVTTADVNVVSASATPYRRVKVRVWGPKLNTLEAVTLSTIYEGRL
jgi:prepilin-type N-terminal cleavage/methylation domain-containing protein